MNSDRSSSNSCKKAENVLRYAKIVCGLMPAWQNTITHEKIKQWRMIVLCQKKLY